MDGLFALEERLRRAMSAVTPALLDRRFLWRDRRADQMWFTAGPAPLHASGALRGCGLDVTIVASADPGDGNPAIRYSTVALVDRNGTELLAFHHHPASEAGTPGFPHLHVSAALRPATYSGQAGVVPLDKRHIPTGDVGLPHIVRMLVEEFGVEPIASDWQARLGLEMRG